MSYEPLGFTPDTVYHFTKKSNLNSILKDGIILKFKDTECWFCLSLPDMVNYMRMTIMIEGGVYIDVSGKIAYYPKFIPDDYVVLKLQPLHVSYTRWFRWYNDILFDECTEERLRIEEIFSRAKVGYRGNLKFKQKPPPQILEMTEVLKQYGGQI